VLNFGNEPGLKSEISACGPSARSRRRGAFLGITRGLRAAQGGVDSPIAEKGGPKKSIALDQTGYGAIQRVHLGPLNRTFPALYFPGSPLSVENHCFGTLGQSASFRRRYLS